MVKLDPDHPTIRIMMSIILLYLICSFILNNFIQKDYDYNKILDKINNSKKSEDLIEPINEIKRVSIPRFVLLMSTAAILFLFYVYYKYQTNRSESNAIFLLMIIGMTGKLIEKLGISNCLNVPIIDPKGSPSNVLLFDMCYTNFFAYFLDFLYAFVAVIVLTGNNTSIFEMFKKTKFKELVRENLSIYSNGKLKFQNIVRFLIYMGTIIVFWNWGSIIRPKITLLLHRYLGIPVVDRNKLELEDEKDKDKSKPELVSTISSIGILSAATVEGLIFTGLLFPMRKYFIYALGNSNEYNSDKFSILGKFLGLVIIIPICIIFLTKYTLSSKNPSEYRGQKFISIVLLGYMIIPLIMLMIHSIFKLKVLDVAQKYKNIFTIAFISIPIIVALILNITKNNSISYITYEPHLEKMEESYMSDSVTSECDESQNKYKYAVVVVTIVMMIFSFGPLLSINKIQPFTGFLYSVLVVILIKIIYMFQDNYEPYNILNPLRHSKNSTDIDLDNYISIEASFAAIFSSIIILMLFRRLNLKKF